LAAAEAVLTNNPAPIIAPIHNATRLQAVRDLFMLCSSSRVSFINFEMDFVMNNRFIIFKKLFI